MEKKQILRLLLVYNADFSIKGALDYAAQMLRGKEDCALCEVTYDGVVENKTWKTCKVTFGVPVEGVYRNKLNDELTAEVDGDFPSIVADHGGAYTKLLGSTAISDCIGDPSGLARELQTKIDELGFPLAS